MVEDIAWWVLVTIAGFAAVIAPMVFIVAARDIARGWPPPVSGGICALGVFGCALGASIRTHLELTLLAIASAVLWLIALVVIARAYSARSDHG